MRRYALEQISGLLNRLAFEVEHARAVRDADAVHDLRVTIRRFGRSLRAFSPFVPPRAVKQIKNQLRHMMDLAGEVRNRDITMDLLREAQIEEPLVAVKDDRELAMRILVSELERWQVENEAVRWRAALEVPAL
jgi:CHAD domain-containing protein